MAGSRKGIRVVPFRLVSSLMLAGIALISSAAWDHAQALWTQARLAGQLRAMPARESSATRRTAAVVGGDAAAPRFPWNLSVPRLGMSVMVLDGDDPRTLAVAAGRIRGTGIPGRPGTIGIAAHRDTFFRALRRVAAGDRVVLETADGPLEYFVVSMSIVNPEDTWVLEPGPAQTLVLVTCYPFSFVGPASRRFVVRAVAVGS